MKNHKHPGPLAGKTRRFRIPAGAVHKTARDTLKRCPRQSKHKDRDGER